jgi:hypothetical protein
VQSSQRNGRNAWLEFCKIQTYFTSCYYATQEKSVFEEHALSSIGCIRGNVAAVAKSFSGFRAFAVPKRAVARAASTILKNPDQGTCSYRVQSSAIMLCATIVYVVQEFPVFYPMAALAGVILAIGKVWEENWL